MTLQVERKPGTRETRGARAIEAWRAHHDEDRDSALLMAPTASRESRMDDDRRAEVRARQEEAVAAHLAAPASERTGRTAVVAHRSSWFAGRVQAELSALGFETVLHVEDGADAVGVCLATQPDLLVVEDVLSRMTGAEVLGEVRTYCPSTVCIAQVGTGTTPAALVEAGAHAGLSRSVRPADLAQRAVTLLNA